MTSTVRESFDPSTFKLPALDQPPPPRYYDRRGSPISSSDTKTQDDASYTHGPWLLRRTSVHVESTPSNTLEDNLSDHASIATTKSDEKRAVRNLLSRFGRQPSSDQYNDDRISVADSHETSVFGTTVSIEAGQPRKVTTTQREMRGLEQAASVRRWAGDGRPAEAWGKLNKDPELWDPSGDTLVYFGYQRPQASFRLRSSLLEATKSDILLGKLQDGQRTSKAQSMLSPTPDIQRLNLNGRGHKAAPSVAGSTRSGVENPIRYEIHFPPPEGCKTTILRHHITTRNLLAMLLNKPLVGLTFYQALVDLSQRLQLVMPQGTDCAHLLITYLSASHLINVSNNPAAAAGLLAWCEDSSVQWRDGWRESFVHCCGMYARLKDIPVFQDISHVSRALLERAHLELEARIQDAEDKLSTFNFDSMWAGSEVQLHPSRSVFDSFRHFLQQYYTKAHKHWPPQVNGQNGGCWLTSDLIFKLQRDFAALYEFHVDRDAVWDKGKDPGELYCKIIRKASQQPAEPQNTEVCLAKLLYRFDETYKYVRTPHPFPLLPDSIAIRRDAKQPKTNFFGSKNKVLEKRIISAFSEASNATILEPGIAANGLAEAFLRFEKTDSIGEVDPQSARKARWMLLYGILQVLSTLSVDTPDLFFTEDVSYFLNPRLKGTPPWKTDAKDTFKEASQRLSYCWIAPQLSWGKDGKDG